MSRLPPGYAATSFTPASSLGFFGLFSSDVNATACDVSSPIMPARIGLPVSAPSAAVAIANRVAAIAHATPANTSRTFVLRIMEILSIQER